MTGGARPDVAAPARRFVTFDEARNTILGRARDALMPAEEIPLDDSLGRTLRQDVIASEPNPAFDNSAMDGYAVRAADISRALEGAPVQLSVVEVVPAGRVATRAIAAGEAIRIMTGAAIPAGADTIVPVERTTKEGEQTVRIHAAFERGEHIRPSGEDFASGTTLVDSGAVIDPAVIALLAATGHASVTVAMPPRVAILSTGDELVMPGDPVGPGQIRDSNTHTLRAMVRDAGCDTGPCWHLMDDAEAVAAATARVLPHCEAIVTIGGVSAGDFDPVKQALSKLGDVELWRVGMRPGQPQAFGVIDGKLFFGLPGNPVSSAIVFEMLVRPALWSMLGRKALDRPTVRAVLAEDVVSKEGRRDFLRVTLEPLSPEETKHVGAAWRAHLTGTQSSGAVSSLHRADGLAVIPDIESKLPVGTLVEVLPLRAFGSIN